MTGPEQSGGVLMRAAEAMKLAGPAIQHQHDLEEAERVGRLQAEAVSASLKLLTDFSSAQSNQDLQDWLEAWQAAQSSNTRGDEQKQKNIVAIAGMLYPFIQSAKEWDQNVRSKAQ